MGLSHIIPNDWCERGQSAGSRWNLHQTELVTASSKFPGGSLSRAARARRTGIVRWRVANVAVMPLSSCHGHVREKPRDLAAAQRHGDRPPARRQNGTVAAARARRVTVGGSRRTCPATREHCGPSASLQQVFKQNASVIRYFRGCRAVSRQLRTSVHRIYMVKRDAIVPLYGCKVLTFQQKGHTFPKGSELSGTCRGCRSRPNKRAVSGLDSKHGCLAARSWRNLLGRNASA